MRKFLKQIAVLFGFNRDSKFVNDYLNDQNTRSGIFMGGIIAILEVWLIARQTKQYFDYGYSFDVPKLFNYISIFLLFLLTGLAVAVYCFTDTAKNMSQKKKMILSLVFGGLALLMSFYVFDKQNFAKWDSAKGFVSNTFLIVIYTSVFLIASIIICSSLLKKLKGIYSKWFDVFLIALFAVCCLAFGIRVSYTDHARLISQNYAPNEIICFLMMAIYVACLLIWKPWISILLNVAVFLGFYFMIYAWDQNNLAAQTAVTRHDIVYYVESFTEGDFINYITFLVSLTTVCIMIYHQRRQSAIKDEELVYIANYDTLTGLHNFDYFINEVNDYMVLNPNHLDEKMYLFINLDNFKTYNDQRGFIKGNEFLTTVGNLIASTFTEKNDVVCRQSDDHYIVFAPSTSYEEKLKELNNKVIALDNDIKPEIRVGGYILSQKEDVRRAVDKARYASTVAKSKNRLIIIYDKAMHDGYHLMQYVIHNIDKAVEEGWVRPYYQPVVWSTDKKLCGTEALARWVDPVRGMLPPKDFVPTLEDTKLIHKLDSAIIEQVCRDIRKSLDEGKPVVPCSINLSRLDFELMDPVALLEGLVSKYNIPKEYLHVEVTESALMDNVGVLAEAVRALKEKNYALWLDDFGSGYSSLNVLKDFDFDVLKIDMKFLSGFANNKKARPLIESVITMAEKLGMRTLTEGVETVEQVDFLAEAHCGRLQGYLFGKPMPRDELYKKIDDKELKVSKELF